MGMGIGQILYMVAAILIAFFYWLIGPRQSVKKRSVVRPNITSRRSVRQHETLYDIFGLRQPQDFSPD